VQADHHLELSLQCAAGQGSPDWTARTLMLQAGVAANRLDHPRALEIVRRMYGQCERSGDRLLPVAGLNFEANALAFAGDLEGALALTLEAARRARELRAHSYLFDALDNAAWLFIKLGRLADAAAQAEEAVAVAVSFDHVSDAWRSMPVLCSIYRLAGAPEAARAALERMPAPPAPCPEHEGRARALLAAAEGRHDEAADGLVRAMAILREQGHAYDEEQSLPWLIDALLLSGRLDKAQAELEAAAGPRLSGSAELKAHVQHGRASLARARGETDTARAALEALADSGAAPLWRAWACVDLAGLEAEAGRTEAALRLLDRVPGALREHPLVQALHERLRAPHPAPAALQRAHLWTRR
jgi:tetratricopeptide (TPR) repeat protein